MLKISRVVIISILIVTQWPLWAQNNTNSPYTRFGYGELADRSFGAGRAMGGVGFGMRSSKQINPMNPASYTSMDSLTFLFDFGVTGQMSWFTDGVNNRKDMNANLDYVAMQFPLSKRIAMSLGILPYSFVGYNFGSIVTEGDAPYQEQFLGNGGLNDVYAGVSIDIWKKRLSFGLNVGYMFGNIAHAQNIIYTADGARNVAKTQRIEVRDLKLDFGLQYSHPFSATQRFVLGLAFSPANQLNTKAFESEVVGSTSTGGYSKTDTIRGGRFDIPNSYGLGFSYVKDNKLTVALDALYETWDKAYFANSNNEFENRMRLSGGVEFIPGYTDRSFFNRVRYRAGAHYSNSYLQINSVEENGKTGFGYNEYGVSVGLGLPLVDNRSILNVAFEYIKIKPESKLMIDEQYFRLTLNYTFNEFWFYKQKMD